MIQSCTIGSLSGSGSFLFFQIINFFIKGINVYFCSINLAYYLGISGTDMSPDIAKAYGLPNVEGAFVAKVTSGPARKAGLYIKDIITAIDNTKITNFEQLLMEVRNRQVGDKVVLTVNRGGKTLKLTVELAELPEIINQ